MEPKPSGSLPAPVLVPAPVNLSPRSRNLMALKTKGPAHFSTDMGRRPPRDAFEFMAVAVRSDPEADRDKMIESLRKNFPLECRLLTPTTAVVQEYFDGWDIKYHNYTFLYKVFQKIAGANAAQSLALTGQVQDVAARWRATNEIAFRNLSLDQCLEDVFTPHDIEEHGLDIIVDVWKQLQQEKVNEGASSFPRYSLCLLYHVRARHPTCDTRRMLRKLIFHVLAHRSLRAPSLASNSSTNELGARDPCGLPSTGNHFQRDKLVCNRKYTIQLVGIARNESSSAASSALP